MKAPISKPVNDTQRAFNELCEKGGGVKGGPARGKVLALLKESGQSLNKMATSEMTSHLVASPLACPGATWLNWTSGSRKLSATCSPTGTRLT
jgi:hypothetical protein